MRTGGTEKRREKVTSTTSGSGGLTCSMIGSESALIGNPTMGAHWYSHAVNLYFPTIMVSTRQGTKSCQIVQDDPSGDNGEDYGPEEEGSGSIMTQESKSKASGKAVSKQKGKQPERRRGTGRLSKLPDMPLDVLYEVRRTLGPITNCGISGDVFDTCRYSPSSTLWICCGCRGPARPFVTFSPASPRDRFG